MRPDRTLRLVSTWALLLAIEAPGQKPPGQKPAAEQPAAKAAVPAAGAPVRDGEQCASDRWYTFGGNAARNASSASAAVLRRPLLAWRQAIAGEIVGEPLVWGEHVVLGLRISDKRRAIEVRRLGDGTVVGRRELNSTTESWPALWGNEVVWRVNTDGLELLRIGKKSVDLVTRSPKAKELGPPLRLGTRLWAVVDGAVTCMRAADFRVLWRSRDRGFVGPVSIGGQELYALRGIGDRQFAVVALDRDDGAERASSAALMLTKDPGDDLCLQLAGPEMLVRFGQGHLLAQYQAGEIDLNAARLRLPLSPGAPLQPAAMPLLRALDAQRQVGSVATALSMQLGLFDAGTDKGKRLDACELHRDLARVPPTLAAGVVYFGACAVELKELRMLWRLDQLGDRPLPRTRLVPAGRTLLLAGEREVVALREDAPVDPIAAELTAAWRQQQRDSFTGLVDQAIAASDLDLALDLLARCRELNVEEGWATKRQKDIETRQKGKVVVSAQKAAAVRASAEGAVATALDAVHRSLASWTTRSDLERRQALGFVLDAAPGHAGAAADVRRLLPPDVVSPEPFAAADWLDFLDAIAHTKVSFFEARLDDFEGGKLDSITAQNKQQLLEWRSRWRPDLKAVLSNRMLLFSPITQPGSLAKALATGELVCDALESMFAGMPSVRNDPRPMLVFIYPDRDEYLAESKKLGVASAEWAAGYYSDYLNELVAKSRLYVPSDDAGFASIMPTLAHELTHQWLMDRCPAFTPDPVASRVGPKAFWIVEGFASLVEQFEFDVARRQFRLGNGSLERADLVASATPLQLLGWKWLTDCRRIDYGQVTEDASALPISSSVHLGQSFRATRLGLFYAQSAMLARYLYNAEDGRRRQALLEFVMAYYTGDLDKLDFAKAFGVSAEDLGPKVVEYSKKLLQ